MTFSLLLVLGAGGATPNYYALVMTTRHSHVRFGAPLAGSVRRFIGGGSNHHSSRSRHLPSTSSLWNRHTTKHNHHNHPWSSARLHHTSPHVAKKQCAWTLASQWRGGGFGGNSDDENTSSDDALSSSRDTSTDTSTNNNHIPQQHLQQREREPQPLQPRHGRRKQRQSQPQQQPQQQPQRRRFGSFAPKQKPQGQLPASQQHQPVRNSNNHRRLSSSLLHTTTAAAAAATADTTNNNNNNNNSNLHVSVSAVQGYRSYMEDEYVIAQDFAAVFDGHGGKAVSRYLRQNLVAHLQAALPQVLYHKQQMMQAAACVDDDNDDDETTKKDPTNSNSTATATMTMTSSQSNNKDNPAQKSKEELPRSSLTEPTVQDYCIALRIALDKVDREVQRINHWSFQGSTAVATWLHYNTTTAADDATTTTTDDTTTQDILEDSNTHLKNDNNDSGTTTTTTTTLIVANIGDSRAIYGLNGRATPLTRDHKPDDPTETKRIEAQGGRVIWCGPMDEMTGKPLLDEGIYRVNGNLALSRAIGDRSERPAVTAEPDITYIQVLKNDVTNNNNNNSDDTTNNQQKAQNDDNNNNNKNVKEYVVLATDGLWDVFTNQEVVDIIDLLLDKAVPQQRPLIADVLVREALRRGAYDNITVIIIWLNIPGCGGSEDAPDDATDDGTVAEDDASSSRSNNGNEEGAKELRNKPKMDKRIDKR